jgi:hypothetical protein
MRSLARLAPALLALAPAASAQTSLPPPIPLPIPLPGSSGPIHVSPTGSPTGDGKSWAQAVDDVQHAAKLAAQTTGKEIWIAAGTYKHAGSIDLGGYALKLYGGFAGTETQLDQRDPEANVTVLDGGGSYGVLTLPDAHGPDTVIDGLTVRNGSAERGGGLYTYAGSPTLRNLVFEGNKAQPTPIGSLSNADGGAIYCYSGSPLIERCRFLKNEAADDGGALYLYSGSPVIRDCVFEQSIAKGDGGAVWCYEGAASLWNCAIRLSFASGNGGAIWCYDAPLDVLHATLVENSASGGAAIESAQGLAVVRNSIVYANLSFSSPAISGGPVVTYSCVEGGYAGAGNVSGAPLLADPSTGDFTPGSGSPCLDAADSSALPAGLTTDLFGNPRQVDLPGVPDTGAGPPPAVDMGAVERQIVPSLEASPAALSLAAGGVLKLQLHASAQHAGSHYLVLGSTAGTSPGLPLGSTVLPLSVDPYFGWTLANPNVFPLSNTFGTLDVSGSATASFTLVAGSPPQWAGAQVHHAYVVIRTSPVVEIAFVSNPVGLLLDP